jgi:hypothetical protein
MLFLVVSDVVHRSLVSDIVYISQSQTAPIRLNLNVTIMFTV